MILLLASQLIETAADVEAPAVFVHTTACTCPACSDNVLNAAGHTPVTHLPRAMPLRVLCRAVPCRAAPILLRLPFAASSCLLQTTALAMDYGQSNPWVALRKAVGLPRAASSCPLTNLLLRLRGQQVQQCSALLEVLLSSFLLEHPRPLAAHQV